MNTYIALLIGINVGGHGKLPMKELASILDSLGYLNIKTYIQSGNVLLQSTNELGPNQAELIAEVIEEHKGFKPAVMLIDIATFQSIIEANPFPTDDGKTLHFFFFDKEPLNPDLERLAVVKVESEEYLLGERAFYLFAPDGIGRSKLVSKVEAALGVPVTARNWNTVKKLASMGAEASG